MDPKLSPCIYYAIIRIAVDEGAFYDPEDPSQPMPIVKKHLAEFIQKCPYAELDYNIKLKDNEENKRKLISMKAAQDILRRYYNTFISGPAGDKPTLAEWEKLSPLPDELSSFMRLFNSEDKERSRSRKQRKNRKQTRKQRKQKQVRRN
jgi:hypothetical protein